LKTFFCRGKVSYDEFAVPSHSVAAAIREMHIGRYQKLMSMQMRRGRDGLVTSRGAGTNNTSVPDVFPCPRLRIKKWSGDSYAYARLLGNYDLRVLAGADS
jgi:hypothetical protein